MIAFTLKETGQQYTLPKDFSDITLERFLDFTAKQKELLGPKIAAELDDPNGNPYVALAKLTKTEEHQLYQRLLGYWANIDKATFNQLSYKECMKLAAVVMLYSMPIEITPKDTVTDTVEHEGTVYNVASYDLSDLTMGDLSEISRAQKAAEDALRGVNSLPDLLAILLREDVAEVLDAKKIAEKRAKFMSMDMNKVFNIAFFLAENSRNYLPHFNIYLKVMVREQLTKTLSF
jgi:hypothetical protein